MAKRSASADVGISRGVHFQPLRGTAPDRLGLGNMEAWDARWPLRAAAELLGPETVTDPSMGFEKATQVNSRVRVRDSTC